MQSTNKVLTFRPVESRIEFINFYTFLQKKCRRAFLGGFDYDIVIIQ